LGTVTTSFQLLTEFANSELGSERFHAFFKRTESGKKFLKRLPDYRKSFFLRDDLRIFENLKCVVRYGKDKRDVTRADEEKYLEWVQVNRDVSREYASYGVKRETISSRPILNIDWYPPLKN